MNESISSELIYRKFRDLMPYRVTEILLVASEYDGFVLEEDGGLTERLISEYNTLFTLLINKILSNSIH